MNQGKANNKGVTMKDTIENQMQNKRGEWVPALPYPFYTLGKQKCSCGKSFWHTKNYQAHYALEHIVLGNEPL